VTLSTYHQLRIQLPLLKFLRQISVDRVPSHLELGRCAPSTLEAAKPQPDEVVLLLVIVVERVPGVQDAEVVHEAYVPRLQLDRGLVFLGNDVDGVERFGLRLPQ